MGVEYSRDPHSLPSRKHLIQDSLRMLPCARIVPSCGPALMLGLFDRYPTVPLQSRITWNFHVAPEAMNYSNQAP